MQSDVHATGIGGPFQRFEQEPCRVGEVLEIVSDPLQVLLVATVGGPCAEIVYLADRTRNRARRHRTALARASAAQKPALINVEMRKDVDGMVVGRLLAPAVDRLMVRSAAIDDFGDLRQRSFTDV